VEQHNKQTFVEKTPTITRTCTWTDPMVNHTQHSSLNASVGHWHWLWQYTNIIWYLSMK